MTARIESWNRVPKVHHARVFDVSSRQDDLPTSNDGTTALPFGNGRSYGDVCLNEDGTLLRTRYLDHFIAFDADAGILTCEAGVMLKDILDFAVPRGWFLPVTPGTRFVTVGGAIANDVHGKNHHVHGTFGHHVEQFELLRSDGTRLVCGLGECPEMFAATIGGLGLTGLVTWAKIKLFKIANALMSVEADRFANIEEFWTRNAEAESRWPYIVAWIDCTHKDGRGILYKARHAIEGEALAVHPKRSRQFPIDLPFSLVNRPVLKLFNEAYYRKPLPHGPTLKSYIPYFYPLDALKNWNRVYGKKGFFQYQCVLPSDVAQEGVADMLSIIAKSGTGSFLAVLKTFGSRKSIGMLSFARAGATLALDFPNQGDASEKLFIELDAVVKQANGAIYPAKDARMSASLFQSGFPLWQQFSTFVDPSFSSSFWRRVTR